MASRLVKATFHYQAIEDNELSFRAGDEIELLEECNTDWWEGRLQGVSGYFPANRVEHFGAAKQAAVLPPNWQRAKNGDGVMYFYNTETRESRWTPPEAAHGPQVVPEPEPNYVEHVPEKAPISPTLSPTPATPPSRNPKPGPSPGSELPPALAPGLNNLQLDSELLILVEGTMHFDLIPPTFIAREGPLSLKYERPGKSKPDKKDPLYPFLKDWKTWWGVLCPGLLLIFKESPPKLKKQDRFPLVMVQLDTLDIGPAHQQCKKKNSLFLANESGSVLFVVMGGADDGVQWEQSINASLRSTCPDDCDAFLQSMFLGSEVKAVESSPTPGKPSGTNDSITVDNVPKDQTSIKNLLAKFFRTRPTVEKLKQDGILPMDGTFGGLLTLQAARQKRTMPSIITLCIKEIEERGLDSVGIYRVSGPITMIHKLRLLFNDNDDIDIGSVTRDVHAIAGLFKLYFRELALPLFTIALYDQFVAAQAESNHDNKLSQLKTIVHKLPPIHFEVLAYLMTHLHKVSTHSATNKMDISNLSIVFGPTLMRSPNEDDPMQAVQNMGLQNAVVELCITYHEWIFGSN